MTRKLLTLKQVAELLSLSTRTIQNYCSERTIPYLKINGEVRFDVVQLERWINSKMIKPLNDRTIYKFKFEVADFDDNPAMTTLKRIEETQLEIVMLLKTRCNRN